MTLLSTQYNQKYNTNQKETEKVRKTASKGAQKQTYGRRRCSNGLQVKAGQSSKTGKEQKTTTKERRSDNIAIERHSYIKNFDNGQLKIHSLIQCKPLSKVRVTDVKADVERELRSPLYTYDMGKSSIRRNINAQAQHPLSGFMNHRVR